MPAQAQKLVRPPSQWEKVGHGGMYQSSQIQKEVSNRRIEVQANLGKRVRPYIQNNQSKKD
jgi:hypothetical protein